MNITIIGAGNMSSGLVKQLAQAGHAVRLTARDICIDCMTGRGHRSRLVIEPNNG